MDVWAPGEDIISASRRSDSATEFRSGTSQAVPFVAGTAALYLQNASGEFSSVRVLVSHRGTLDFWSHRRKLPAWSPSGFKEARGLRVNPTF